MCVKHYNAGNVAAVARYEVVGEKAPKVTLSMIRDDARTLV